MRWQRRAWQGGSSTRILHKYVYGLWVTGLACLANEMRYAGKKKHAGAIDALRAQ